MLRTAIVFVVLLVAVAPVTAQPAEPDATALEEARQQFESGNAVLDAGKYEEAIVAFERSYKLAKRPSALFMLATTYRRRWETRGDLADARQARQLYDNFVKAASDHASAPYARDQMASLDRQIREAEAAQKRGVAGADVSGSSEYRTALGLVAEGKYREALVQTAAARRVAGTGPSQLARIWLVAGRAHALSGTADAAVAAFQRALSIDPDIVAPLDMDAPDGQAFARAQQGLRGKAPLSVSADAPAAAPGGRAIAIKSSVDSDPMRVVAKIAVRYRIDGTESFSEVVGAPGQPLDLPAGVLPARTKDYKLFFYVIGYDDAGAVAATWGTARDPRRIDVLTSAAWDARFGIRKPVYKKWWFWSAAAATVVGGAVIFFAVAPTTESGDGPRVDAPLGRILGSTIRIGALGTILRW